MVVYGVGRDFSGGFMVFYGYFGGLSQRAREVRFFLGGA